MTTNMAYGLIQLVDALASPVTVTILVAAVALLCRAGGRRVISRYLLVYAALVGYLGSIPVIADALLGPLERQYPPLQRDHPLPAVGFVVVLGSGYTPHDGVPITAALDRDWLARVVEGVRLARLLGSVKLVLSGGAPEGSAPPATGYSVLARDLSTADTSIIVLNESLNTAAESRAVARLLGPSPFILVTSAYHMPRAMRSVQRAGANPIAAPTGQRVGGATRRWFGLLPTSGGLEATECALHEYLGLGALAVGV